jgi:hypothetical protein
MLAETPAVDLLSARPEPRLFCAEAKRLVAEFDLVLHTNDRSQTAEQLRRQPTADPPRLRLVTANPLVLDEIRTCLCPQCDAGPKYGLGPLFVSTSRYVDVTLE